MITKDLLFEVAPHRFVAEASDLGLKPGEWPAMLPTKIGNGEPLLRGHVERGTEGDLIWVRYRQENGCLSVKIIND